MEQKPGVYSPPATKQEFRNLVKTGHCPYSLTIHFLRFRSIAFHEKNKEEDRAGYQLSQVYIISFCYGIVFDLKKHMQNSAEAAKTRAMKDLERDKPISSDIRIWLIIICLTALLGLLAVTQPG